MMQQTSIEAYESVKKYIPVIQNIILTHIDFAGPDTCDHMEQVLDLSHQTCSASIRALVKKGLLEDSGKKGITRSGRKAIIWKLTEINDETSSAIL
jgi:predicted HTH transcriptional regulator